MKNSEDFFSKHPPVTVFEKYQVKFGMNLFIRPKDLLIKRHLNRLGFDGSKRFLDFGCAGGVWTERLIGKKRSGVGVDIAKDLINYAQKRPGKKAQYLLTDKKWSIKKNSFDFCVSFDVFEHIKEKEAELEKIYKALSKEGKILFYIINYNNKFTFDWFFEKLGSDFLYRRADHDKEVFADPEKFKKMLERVGFKDVDYQLHDGPFNLFWDVFCYTYLGVLEKLLKDKKHKEMLLKFNDKVVRVVTPINSILDKPFLATKNSNGFLIWGEK